MTRPTSEDNNNRKTIIIATVVSAALIGLAGWQMSAKPAGNNSNIGTKDAPLSFDLQDVPFVGDKEAPVTVVVVEDFKCPACKMFDEQVLPQIKANYVETGKAKIHTMFMPFLAEMAKLDVDDSKLAAQAYKCVYDISGNKAADRYKSIVFRAQGSESEAWANKDRLKELTDSIEIDQDRFAECIDTDQTAGRVDAEEEQVQKLGVTGTPSIFINGVKASSGDYAGYAKALDEALAGTADKADE